MNTVKANNEAIVFDEAISTDLFPLTMFNHEGFYDEYSQQLSHLNMELRPIVPAFPIYSQVAGAPNEFIGVVVPSKYLDLPDVTVHSSSQSSSRTTIQISTIPMGRESMNLKTLKAWEMLREQGLNPAFLNNRLYGFKPGVDMRVGYTESLGLSLDASGGKSVIYIGDRDSWGVNIDYNPAKGVIGKISGWNLASSLNLGLRSFNGSLSGGDSQELFLSLMNFTSSFQGQIIRNYSLGLNTDPKDPRFRITKEETGAVVQNTEYKLPVEISKASLSSEHRQAFEELNKNLSEEVDWKTKIEKSYLQEITSSTEDNQFIQNLCDRIAEGYQMPKEIWPQCRIQGTLVPNAFAYPGGRIYITAGLLGILSDLDSVAYVLGHEVGHVFERHTSKNSNVVPGLIFALQTFNVLNSGFFLTGGAGAFGNVTFLSWWYKSLEASFVGGYVTQAASLPLVAGYMAYSRSHEWQADRLGHEISFAVGAKQELIYKGWNEFSQYIQEYFLPSKDLWTQLMSTHPESSHRGEEIDERYADIKERLSSYSTQNNLPEEWRKQYKIIHKAYYDASQKWGAEKKQEILKEKKVSKSSETQSLMLASLLRPGSRCVLFSLGGAKGGDDEPIHWRVPNWLKHIQVNSHEADTQDDGKKAQPQQNSFGSPFL